MKISKITIHKFRSIQHTTLDPVDYTVFAGPNNHGKSNILRALLFFFDEIKITKDDFLREENGNQEPGLWVEVEYSQLSDTELANLPSQYVLGGARMRIRRVATLQDLKTVAHGYENKDGEELLSENDFFGAKGVGKAKLGEVVYIPAVRDIKDELKPQGSSVLANLVKRIITPSLADSEEYKQMITATEAFEKAIRGDDALPSRDKRTYANLNEIERTLAEELEDWQYDVAIQLSPIEPSEVVKQGASFSLKRPGEPEGPPESKGHGIQRSLLVGLLKILAEAEKATRLKSGTAEKKTFRPSFTLILFEEPEIFQHPPLQARLFRHLRLLSQRPDLQVMVSTHSSLFFDMALDLDSTVLVRKTSGTQTFQVSAETKAKLNDAAIAKQFNLAAWLNPDRNILFFSDLVVLVEGATEKLVIPYLCATMGGRLDGVYILDCGLKTNIKFLMAVCGDLAIPHTVLHDSDEDKAADHFLRTENVVIASQKNQWTVAIHECPGKFESYCGITASGSPMRKKPLEALQFLQDNEIARSKVEAILPELFL